MNTLSPPTNLQHHWSKLVDTDESTHALISVQVLLISDFHEGIQNDWLRKCSRYATLTDILFAVQDLETRKKVISKKFRSDEKPAGVPAAPSNITFPKKKKNPARVSRWRLRLEQIKVRKEDKKWSSLPAEDITNQLVIQLDKKEDRQDRSERRPYQPHSSIRWKWEVPLWHCWVYLGQSQWLSSD